MRSFFRVVLALVLIGAVVGLGSYVYNAGVIQGLASSGKVVLPDGATAVAPYAYYGLHRPWGFSLFGFIGPLLFFFLIIAVVRGLFFRGWRRGPWMHGPWNHGGDWDKNVPPMMQEWHRKMHESTPETKQV